MNKQLVERLTADLKTLSLFNITEHSVYLNSMYHWFQIAHSWHHNLSYPLN